MAGRTIVVKPCPCCGGVELEAGCQGCQCGGVKCLTCGCKIERGLPKYSPKGCKTLDDVYDWATLRAIRAWNKRKKPKCSGKLWASRV